MGLLFIILFMLKRRTASTAANIIQRTKRDGAGVRFYTCKSLSEALIFASTNPQYDDRLFIELQVQ